MQISPIIRLPKGTVNEVNDAVIGMPTAPGGLGNTQFAGQLGKFVQFDDSNVKFNSAVGTCYGGIYQYVRLAAAAAVPVVGQILFWDTLTNAADNLFQVTTAESGSADGAMLIAGICLSKSVTVGNYTLIQVEGPVYVQFRATLTATGAAGSRVYAAAAGAGADLGFADVIDSSSPTLFSDVSKMMGRFLGIAQDTPTSGGLKRVILGFKNLRG